MPRTVPSDGRRDPLALPLPRFLLIGLVAAGCLLTACGPDRIDAGETAPLVFRQLFQTRVENPAFPQIQPIEGEVLFRPTLVQQFYQRRLYLPAWTDEVGPSDKARILLQALQAAEDDGLQPEDYHLLSLLRLLTSYSLGARTQAGMRWGESRMALELLLTDAYFLYGSHLAFGRVDPVTLDWVQLQNDLQVEWPQTLETALHQNRVAESLRLLAPSDPAYGQLRTALQLYRRLAEVEVEPISASPGLKRGEADPVRVPALRRRLKLLGDLPAGVEVDSEAFDGAVELALLRFQARHNLPGTGVWDEATATWFDQPLTQRVRTLTANLERWRWLPRRRSVRRVEVNVPDFSLRLLDQGRSVLNMRVVVGQRVTKTPVLINQLVSLVFNPVWEVPAAMILREHYAKIQSEGARFFLRNHLQVVEGWDEHARLLDPKSIDWRKVPPELFQNQTYRLMQLSDRDNPLGRLKFLFPNRFNVYLHDTPRKELFDREVRDYSHGCIRIERPVDLAVELLKPQSFWTPERILAATSGLIEQWHPIRPPVAIYLLYWTAWVDEAGGMQFREDLYGRDQELEGYLQAPLVPQP